MQMADLIIVKAIVTMKKTEEGGRITGFRSGYRPSHVFEMPDDVRNLSAFVGDIQFDGQELFEPGETKMVTVRFLKAPPIEKHIVPGQKWFINEGARVLGFGEILEILEA